MLIDRNKKPKQIRLVPRSKTPVLPGISWVAGYNGLESIEFTDVYDWGVEIEYEESENFDKVAAVVGRDKAADVLEVLGIE